MPSSQIFVKSSLALTAIVALLFCVSVSRADEDPANWNIILNKFEIKGNDVYFNGYRKITVNNKRGDEYAELYFFENRFVELKTLKIFLKDSDGNVLKQFEKKDLTKSCGFGAGYQVFDDICYYSLSVTSPQYPYSIEIFEESKYNNLFIFRGTQLPTEVPITSVVCSLVTPIGLPIRYKVYAIPLEFDETILKGNRVLVWTGNDIPKVDDDTLSAIESDWSGLLGIVVDQFKFINSEFSGGTWAEIGKWYAGILKDRYDWDYIKPQLASTGALEDVNKKSLDNIISDYRYVSVSIGTSGWRPRRLDEITKTKYGDCKDLSMLLVNNLRNQNVETYPALMLTRSEGMLDTTFPNFSFNHVITATISGGDTVWMDPTCRTCPLGHIPWADEKNYALLVTDTAGVLVQTSGSTSEQNRIVRLVKAKIDSKRNVRAEIKFMYSGHYASYLRELFSHKTGEELNRFMESILTGKSAKFEVKKYSIENQDNIYKPLIVQISALSERPLRKVGRVIYFDPCLAEPELGVNSSRYEIERPMRFTYPRSVIDSIWLETDSALAIDSMIFPSDDEFVFEIGRWKVSRPESARNSEVLTIFYSLDKSIVPTDKFDDLRKFSDLIENRDKRLIKLYLK